jgi:hypothetical protein
MIRKPIAQHVREFVYTVRPTLPNSSRVVLRFPDQFRAKICLTLLNLSFKVLECELRFESEAGIKPHRICNPAPSTTRAFTHCFGADGGDRTHTPSRTPDSKSGKTTKVPSHPLKL